MEMSSRRVDENVDGEKAKRVAFFIGEGEKEEGEGRRKLFRRQSVR